MALTGCASQPLPEAYSCGPGFFAGLWHGFVALPSLIIGIFSETRIYNFPNCGLRYDFGFVMGFPFSFAWLAIFSGGK